MEYTELGLNQYLQPINAPVAMNSGAVAGYDFNANNERNSIDLGKIRNFNFSAGTGGTIQLGGTANGNGYLVVKDSSGSTIVTVNNNGIAVTGGSVTIANSSGSTIIDPTGLVSSTNFTIGTLSYDTNQAITGNTGYRDIPNSSLDVIIARTSRVLFTASAEIWINNLLNIGSFAMNVGGTILPSRFLNVRSDHIFITLTNIISVGPGTTTFKLQCSTGTASDFNEQVMSTSYVVLGS